MKILTTLLASVIIAALITGCAAKPKPTRTDVMQQNLELFNLEGQLAMAKNSGVKFFAPDGYAESKMLLEKAVKKAIAGDTFTDTYEKALKKLHKAKADTKQSKKIMREVLVVRERARDAGAPKILPREFKALEAELKETLRLIEEGKNEKAQKSRPKLIKSYADLELIALKRDTVHDAKKMIAQAEKAESDEYAPKTLALAHDELALAISVLEAERTQRVKASEHATRSVELAKRSIHITEIVKQFEQGDASEEEKVLWYQKQLSTLHAPLLNSLNFSQDNHELIKKFKAQIEALVTQELENHEALKKANEKSSILEAEVSRLQQHYSDRLSAAQKENEAAHNRYNKVQAMFTKREANVYRQGYNVLLTTYGFDFIVGGSEIQSDNFILLNKIIEAIRIFDNPHVLVMGHTDATGGELVNKTLSTKRAQTVASFLKKIGRIANDRVSFEGYGEARPLASNETKEGRAKNRRIEILIINE